MVAGGFHAPPTPPSRPRGNPHQTHSTVPRPPMMNVNVIFHLENGNDVSQRRRHRRPRCFNTVVAFNLLGIAVSRRRGSVPSSSSVLSSSSIISSTCGGSSGSDGPCSCGVFALSSAEEEGERGGHPGGHARADALVLALTARTGVRRASSTVRRGELSPHYLIRRWPKGDGEGLGWGGLGSARVGWVEWDGNRMRQKTGKKQKRYAHISAAHALSPHKSLRNHASTGTLA